jgi:hypothetical protein
MNERRFLSITGLLLVILGVPAIVSVFQEPDVYMAQTSSRAPASIVPVSATVHAVEGGRNQVKAKSVTIQLNCETQDPDQTIDGTLLRLKYSACKDQVWKNISVVNVSNGFTAAVIDLQQKGFTTDFMDLNEGDNTVEVVASTESGSAVHRTFKVTRIPAAVTNTN